MAQMLLMLLLLLSLWNNGFGGVSSGKVKSFRTKRRKFLPRHDPQGTMSNEKKRK
jgi:hypothetical protein